ncbi:MAG: WYL domain-containing protein [Flavobacteriales bacterium]|nr:WYL domain-containing protein [Flavobacteriales bacterium]MCB0787325.1 WYL domain-containing protein [Flavobacteriales bacterium]
MGRTRTYTAIPARWRILDRCLRNTAVQYTIDDLHRKCLEHGPVSKRTVWNELERIQAAHGVEILHLPSGDGRTYHRYKDPSFSIEKAHVNEADKEQLREALQILQRFKGLPQLAWLEELAARLESDLELRPGAGAAMVFQENPYLSGAKWIPELLDAILQERVVKITYRGAREKRAGTFTFHPHLLKQYNDRWFLLGFQNDRADVTNLMLDRISKLAGAPKVAFRRNDAADWEDHFAEVVGVTVPDTPVERVVLRVAPDIWPLVASKPIHGSQPARPVALANGWMQTTLNVRLNRELVARLLSYGGNLQVVEPEQLREMMQEHVRKMHEHYGA